MVLVIDARIIFSSGGLAPAGNAPLDLLHVHIYNADMRNGGGCRLRPGGN